MTTATAVGITSAPQARPAAAAVTVAREPTQRFPLLNSVRGLAALGVLWYHASEGGLRADARLLPYLQRLNVVVIPLFLVLSGFLLYRPFVAARAHQTPSPSLRRFAWGRVLRIVPAYWVFLLVTAALLADTAVVTGPHAWAYFSFLQMYVDWDGLPHVGITWTLDLEVSLYVLLAGWVLATRHRPLRAAREAGVLLALSAISVGVQGWYAATGGAQGNLDLTAAANLDLFAAGMLLALLSVIAVGNSATARVWRGVGRVPGVWWVLAAVVYWVLCNPLGLPARGDAISAYSTSGFVAEHVLGLVVAVLVVLPAVSGRQDRGAVRRILASPPLLAVGTVSYGLYLWHVFVISIVEQALPLLPRNYDSLAIHLSIETVGSVAVGLLSWRIIERPCLALKGPVGRTRSDAAPRLLERRAR